jgi:hypothetical protein
MPCYDARDTWSKEHAQQAAAILCTLLKCLDPDEVLWMLDLIPVLRQWQKDHENMDVYFERRSAENFPKRMKK